METIISNELLWTLTPWVKILHNANVPEIKFTERIVITMKRFRAKLSVPALQKLFSVFRGVKVRFIYIEMLKNGALPWPIFISELNIEKYFFFCQKWLIPKNEQENK